ncbi:MAG TPA: hypothetical protein VJU52_01090, partial [Flavobacterium sp.]|nr:hypothetical protein [Flavobacterium sp.]
MFFCTALMTTIGCTSSEEPTTTTTPPPNNNIVIPAKSKLSVFASADNQVILPTDYSNLKGTYIYSGIADDIDDFVWKKTSGPSTCIIENPNSIATKVNKMGKGTYEFELTITDKEGITAKDTVRVIVGEYSLPPKEIIFTDLVWSCPMGCLSSIKNIYSHLPADSVFRIYIQRDNSNDWIEVIPLSQWTADRYYYGLLYNGTLEI